MHDRNVLYSALTSNFENESKRREFLKKNLKNQDILSTHEFALEVRT
jgi:hypothetical protein